MEHHKRKKKKYDKVSAEAKLQSLRTRNSNRAHPEATVGLARDAGRPQMLETELLSITIQSFRQKRT